MTDNPHPPREGEKYSGACKYCNHPFSSSKPNRQYGSHACYQASDECRENMAAERERLKSTGHTIHCSNGCGAEIRKPPSRCRVTNFCGKPCRREYFAKRFDRFVASTATIEKIQNYDEFLSQRELPCLIEGCHWEGRNLSTHMNITHGVSGEQFKEMAGFNRKTGVIGAEYARYLQQNATGHLQPFTGKRCVGGNKGTKWRAEGQEHHWKKQPSKEKI